MALPEYFLQELKLRSDITDIASPYVDLKRRGKTMLGLCPFHNEKTASFNIYPDNGSFYCFGCNKGGDVITFVMQIENLDYIDAVRFLAQRAGMNMPEDKVDDSFSKLRTRILEINRESARFFHKTLFEQQGKEGADYCRERGLDKRIIRHFGLGYSPKGGFELVNHLKKLGYTADEMVQANVAGLSRNGNPYDRFKGRLMFPIIDLRGNVVAFGGRILTDEKPKYINTSDTPVYHKSSGLYAMNFAKNAEGRRLILAEGYMDVIALHRAGFTNSIASLGTSLTEEQARIISRYADEAVICYDSDEAGQRATQRAIPILKNSGLFVKVLVLPGKKDPDEFMKSHGDKGPLRFKEILEKSGNDVDYQIQKIKSGYDVETNEGKIKYLAEVVKLLSGLEDEIARDVFAGSVSQELDVDKKAILEMIGRSIESGKKKKRSNELKKQREIPAAATVVNDEKRRNLRLANAEESIIAYLFKHPDKIKEMGSMISPENFITAYNGRVYALLLGKTIYHEVSLSDFSGDLTKDEMSELAKIIFGNQSVVGSWKDVCRSVEIVLGGQGVSNPDALKTASEEDINKKLALLRKQKLGG